MQQKSWRKELLSKADEFVSNRRKGWRERFHITPEGTIKQRPGLIDVQMTWAGETGPWSNRAGFDITSSLAWGNFSQRWIVMWRS